MTELQRTRAAGFHALLLSGVEITLSVANAIDSFESFSFFGNSASDTMASSNDTELVNISALVASAVFITSAAMEVVGTLSTFAFLFMECRGGNKLEIRIRNSYVVVVEAAEPVMMLTCLVIDVGSFRVLGEVLRGTGGKEILLSLVVQGSSALAFYFSLIIILDDDNSGELLLISLWSFLLLGSFVTAWVKYRFCRPTWATHLAKFLPEIPSWISSPFVFLLFAFPLTVNLMEAGFIFYFRDFTVVTLMLAVVDIIITIPACVALVSYFLPSSMQR